MDFVMIFQRQMNSTFKRWKYKIYIKVNMFTWNSTCRITWSISTLCRIQNWSSVRTQLFERGNLWWRSIYLKSKELLLFHRWVNVSRNSTHFAAGSWSVWIKPNWDFNRVQVCEFNGFWADRGWCCQEKNAPLLHLVEVLEDSRLLWSRQF